MTPGPRFKLKPTFFLKVLRKHIMVQPRMITVTVIKYFLRVKSGDGTVYKKRLINRYMTTFDDTTATLNK